MEHPPHLQPLELLLSSSPFTLPQIQVRLCFSFLHVKQSGNTMEYSIDNSQESEDGSADRSSETQVAEH